VVRKVRERIGRAYFRHHHHLRWLYTSGGSMAKESRNFADLDAGGKVAFIAKALIFAVSFGFAFPTIFSD
jgi:hypothetical protein